MSNEPEQRTANDGQLIKSLALRVGFDACGFSKANHLPEMEEPVNRWLGNNYQGEMGYMERNLDKRLDPRILVPDAKTVISVLLNYYPGNPDISTSPPKISRYALSRDYHTVVKDMLYQLLELIRKEYGRVEGRAFVDSAPVFERAWAARAGLGWIGKNSMLVNPNLGSFFFIGELIVDLPVEPTTTKVPNRCGTCTRCLDACPTGAIIAPRVIDSRKCISYLTIEKKTLLVESEQGSLNGWCFGCDICQEACPWNGKISIANCNVIRPTQAVLNISAVDLMAMSEGEFDIKFKDSPLQRAGWKRVISNCNNSQTTV